MRQATTVHLAWLTRPHASGRPKVEELEALAVSLEIDRSQFHAFEFEKRVAGRALDFERADLAKAESLAVEAQRRRAVADTHSDVAEIRGRHGRTLDRGP